MVLTKTKKLLFNSRPFIKLPSKMVQYILLLLKWAHENMGSRYFSYPLLVHVFHLASHARTFNGKAAKKDIGYLPVVSLEVKFIFSFFSHFSSQLCYLISCSFA